MVNNDRQIKYECLVHLDDSLFSFLTLNSQIPSPSVKNPNPILNKSYVNLLLDGDDLPATTNSLNEQRRPMLLIDEYDLRP